VKNLCQESVAIKKSMSRKCCCQKSMSGKCYCQYLILHDYGAKWAAERTLKCDHFPCFHIYWNLLLTSLKPKCITT
jgi:hypothetical protein